MKSSEVKQIFRIGVLIPYPIYTGVISLHFDVAFLFMNSIRCEHRSRDTGLVLFCLRSSNISVERQKKKHEDDQLFSNDFTIKRTESPNGFIRISRQSISGNSCVKQ